MRNRQYTHSHRAAPLLSPEQLAELAAAVRGPAPEGDDWTGRTVAEWMSETLGRPVSAQLGWVYLVRLDGKRRKPRPRHVLADPDAASGVQKKLRPLLRAVATAFPQASVELWAIDEHRIGLKPILHKVWCFDGAAPAGAGATPLRVALSRRLCPSRLGAHRLSSGDHGQHPALRSRTGRLCRARSAPAHTSRSCSSWIAPAGMPAASCASPTTSTCSSCRRIRPSCSPPSISGRSPTPSWQPPFRHHRRPGGRPSRALCRPASPSRSRSAPPPCSIGGHSASENDKGLD